MDRDTERYMSEAKCTDSNPIRRGTLRARLQQRIEDAKSMIEHGEREVKDCEEALDVLRKNKDLETLVNLLDRR